MTTRTVATPGVDQWQKRTQRVLLFISLCGLMLFGGVFTLSFVRPILIEQGAREIVRIEVERRVGEKVDRLTDVVTAESTELVIHIGVRTSPNH